MSEPKLPKEVFYVTATPFDGEKIPYYGRTLNRLYRNMSGVKAFKNANTKRKHKVYRAKVTWEEVE